MILLHILIFILGACLASFALCLANRLACNEDLTAPSHCDFCQHPLTSWQLIPIAGYLLQRGRCHFCRHQLRTRYPLSELGAGLYVLLLFFKFGNPTITFFMSLFFATWTLVLALEDQATTSVTSAFLFGGGFFLLLYSKLHWSWSAPSTWFSAGLFLLCPSYLYFRQQLGSADLLYLIICLSFFGLPKTLWITVLACLIFLATANYQTKQPKQPFLPALGAAALLILLLT